MPLSWVFAVGLVRLVPSDNAPIRTVRDYFATMDQSWTQDDDGLAGHPMSR